jgi:hypothetical protein
MSHTYNYLLVSSVEEKFKFVTHTSFMACDLKLICEITVVLIL